MSLDQYRGVTITLISHLDIRYEGTLDDINPETQSISLSNVRSFGTEGRKGGNPVEEIPPQEMVFPYICFRASDVKDLAVKEEMTAPAPPPPAPVLNDPAIIEYSTAPVQLQQQQQQQYQAQAAGSVRSASPNRDESAARAQSRSPSPAGRQPHHQHHYGHHHQSGHRRGGHRTGSGRARQPRGPVEIPKEAFDFEGANAKLNKDDLVKEFAKLGFNQNGEGSDSDSNGDDDDHLADEAQPAPQKVMIPPRQEFYDKKTSFFDNISCEARARQEALARGGLDPQQRRARMHEERKLNVETFGTATPASRMGRGGSRGRGGYRRNDDSGRRYENDGGQPRWGGGGGGSGRRSGGGSGYGMDQAQYGARGDGGYRRGGRARGEGDAGDV
ncbi:Protein LSM14 A [Allomyces javanicus]|nr:Protein LSM14 A [Allomyces javanicus]